MDIVIRALRMSPNLFLFAVLITDGDLMTIKLYEPQGGAFENKISLSSQEDFQKPFLVTVILSIFAKN